MSHSLSFRSAEMSPLIADDVTMTRQLWHNQVNINFIRVDIHSRLCKNVSFSMPLGQNELNLTIDDLLSQGLTLWPLMASYGNIELGQHWFK